jgi:hypothetical protein
MGAPAIPYAGRTIIALAHEQFVAIRRTVEALFRLAHTSAYQQRVDADADACARFVPGNTGVFMGYDFHLTPAGPKLIEVNTNAGGALLNGLHTASLCDPARLSCLCADLMPVEAIQQRIVRTFVSEYEAVRGAGARPALVAIADERPREQFLYPEFELFAELFAGAGIRAEICDTAELERSGSGGRAARRSRRSRLPARHRLRARGVALGRAARRLSCPRGRGVACASRTPSAREQAPARAVLFARGARERRCERRGGALAARRGARDARARGARPRARVERAQAVGIQAQRVFRQPRRLSR